jgi:nucleotide-binding universal stress UspA family protein
MYNDASHASREVCILAAVDLARTGDDALREAMRLVRSSKSAVLHVVHVIEVNRDMHDANRVDELSRTLDEKREALKERLQANSPEGEEAWSQDVVFHVRLGDPAQAIHQAAVDVDADFIVVGTHARTGVDRLMRPSVAEKLVRSARISVIVAHDKDVTDLRRSDQPDPPRPGEDLTTTGVSARLHLEFLPRTSRISGLV